MEYKGYEIRETVKELRNGLKVKGTGAYDKNGRMYVFCQTPEMAKRVIDARGGMLKRERKSHEPMQMRMTL